MATRILNIWFFVFSCRPSLQPIPTLPESLFRLPRSVPISGTCIPNLWPGPSLHAGFDNWHASSPSSILLPGDRPISSRRTSSVPLPLA
ncbi:hypothetical protein C8Q73DRAFT_252504 [Cubamyces lactineus]|nr:hypothetical protein C8Q73DRAFT_252504 [Cubamyces lactineus]